MVIIEAAGLTKPLIHDKEIKFTEHHSFATKKYTFMLTRPGHYLNEWFILLKHSYAHSGDSYITLKHGIYLFI